MSQQELAVIIHKLRNFHWGENINEMRANFEAVFTMPSHPNATIKSIDVVGIPADLISTPEASSEQIILYLHGGGYLFGSRNTHRRVACDFSTATKAQVLLIDYRLAPEYPFPAALEDGLISYRWLLETGFDSAQIALAGDSAGGNLALGMMLSLRNNREPLPACALLMSPLTDFARTGRSLQTLAEVDPIVSPELLEIVANSYLPEKNFLNSIVSPIYADLSALPPLLIHVGSQEVLLDDSLRLASKATEDNVAVELKVWQELIHCFHQFAPKLAEGREAIDEAGAFIAQRLNVDFT
ncbi:alpha/beta hydrolase [Pleurocapsa sp. PCC 7319]|uniref:alpha/beta hydrolase n=1 Tax=Pleurocapsa sp. PCC 7319 TaxID=118161 RepID=UPI0003829355|nr:alpha/beta hydrolase [Pleurocapsa sp. PCC 7319]